LCINIFIHILVMSKRNKTMEDLQEYITCESCDGEGTVEVIDCGMSASYCCGGCVKDVTCDECDGSGEINNPEY